MQGTGRLARRHRRSTAAAVLVAVLVLGACGGGGSEDATPPTDVDTTSSSSPDTTAEPTTTTTHTPTTKAKPTVAYPSGGPKGAVFPPGAPAYELLATGDCRGLREWMDRDPLWGDVEPEVVHLYRAATSACLGQWDEAIRRFDRLRALAPDFSDPECPQDGECPRCLKLVYDWVADLVRRRKADPGFSPRFVVRPSAPNPCPPTTTTTESTSTTSTTAGTSTSTSRG